jgi:hypothetical protein
MRVTTIVTMAMISAPTVVMAVIVIAALRLGHACQHARARPLQRINNDQPTAPA